MAPPGGSLWNQAIAVERLSDQGALWLWFHDAVSRKYSYLVVTGLGVGRIHDSELIQKFTTSFLNSKPHAKQLDTFTKHHELAIFRTPLSCSKISPNGLLLLWFQCTESYCDGYAYKMACVSMGTCPITL